MIIFRTGLGVGDVLLAAGVLHALQRQRPQHVIVETRYPELFLHNPDAWLVCRDGRRDQLIQNLFGHRFVWRIGNKCYNFFTRHTLQPQYPFPAPGKHLIDWYAESIGLQLLPEERHPCLHLTPVELQAQSWANDCIAVQSSSTDNWTVNKHWIPGRMQQVADELSCQGYSLVQLGAKEDETLQGVKDLRGQTSLRQAAAILANCRLFIGLEGGLVHLARSVNTRSVVIYTHYTLPEETGYPENLNLRDPQAGEPCWQREYCEPCHQSAVNIASAQVITAALEILI